MKHLRFHAIDSATATYIAALSVRPTDSEIVNINRFVRALKDAGIWGSLDGIYIFRGGNEADSKINLKNPGQYNLTKINSPIFTPNKGWSSNSSGYLDTKYNVLTSGGLFQRNSAAIGCAVDVDAQSVGGCIGYTSNAYLIPRHTSNNFLGRLNNTGSGSVAASGAGLHIITRARSSAIQHWRRGSLLATTNITSSALTSSNMLLLTSNTTSLFDSSIKITFAFFGAGLTGRQIHLLNKAYTDYDSFYGA